MTKPNDSAPSDSSDALDRHVETIRDAVNACRKAMIDLPLAHKTLVLSELGLRLAAEEATHIPKAARH